MSNDDDLSHSDMSSDDDEKNDYTLYNTHQEHHSDNKNKNTDSYPGFSDSDDDDEDDNGNAEEEEDEEDDPTSSDEDNGGTWDGTSNIASYYAALDHQQHQHQLIMNPAPESMCTSVMNVLMGIAGKQPYPSKNDDDDDDTDGDDTERNNKWGTPSNKKTILENNAEFEGYVNFTVPYSWVNKELSWREIDLFQNPHAVATRPVLCLAVLGRLVRLHAKDKLRLTSTEATDLFFRVTKLFEHHVDQQTPAKDPLRRMVYLVLKELILESCPTGVGIMLLSSLTRDMTNPAITANRSNALRLLPHILEDHILDKVVLTMDMVKENQEKSQQKMTQQDKEEQEEGDSDDDEEEEQQEDENENQEEQEEQEDEEDGTLFSKTLTWTIERTMTGALTPENNHNNQCEPAVASAALVSSYHLLEKCPAFAVPLINQYRSQIAAAAATTVKKNPKHAMVQFHALSLLFAHQQQHQQQQQATAAAAFQQEQNHNEEPQQQHSASQLVLHFISSSSGLQSPLSVILLIRQTERILLEQSEQDDDDDDHHHHHDRVIYEFFLASKLQHSSDMVKYEAARAILCNLHHILSDPARTMEAAVTVLRDMLDKPTNESEPAIKVACTKLLELVGQRLLNMCLQ